MFSRMKRAACLSPHDIQRRVVLGAGWVVHPSWRIVGLAERHAEAAAFMHAAFAPLRVRPVAAF